MPVFTPKRHEQILAQMIARVVTRTDMSDVADSSITKHILSAAARQDDEQYYQMSLLLQLFSIDTATGDDLDQRAAEIQPGTIIRLAATKSTGTVVFSRNGTSGTVNIPVGTKVKTAGGVIFSTTAAGTITPTSPEQIAPHGIGRDSGLVPVIADLPGSSGNVAAGTVVKFDNKPSGVDEVTNLSAFANGNDKETDDSFRQRLKDFISSLPRSTVQALESGVLGAQDAGTGATILFSKAVEDEIDRGNVELFIDDGTGSAESTQVESATPITGSPATWDGTTTILIGDTSDLSVDDYIGADTDDQFFKINTINANVSVVVDNPGALTIPSGSLATSINPENVTNGLSGPPANSAVGGETTLFTEQKPIKDSDPFDIISSTRGLLVQDTDYTLNPASGQLVFDPPLVASEVIMAEYTQYTGLVELGQKIVDGDSNDRANFPGLRAAGVLVIVKVPQVLLQSVTITVVVKDGFDQDTVKTNVRQAIKDYINTLGISGDVLRNELIRRMMSVSGVANTVVTLPAADVIILDDQLARTTDPNIIVN